MFNALVINKADNEYTTTFTSVAESDLPEGDVKVEVLYSTLNYKDALAITGKSPVVRRFPMVPGIDFVGRVSESNHNEYKAGDLVVLNGWGGRRNSLGWSITKSECQWRLVSSTTCIVRP